MTTTEFIFNVPLYQKVIDGADKIIADLISEYAEYGDHTTFEGYNPFQNKDSTYCVYSVLASRYRIWNHSHRNDEFEESDIRFCTLKCLRYGDKIEMCLWLDAKDYSIMKVGQYPSIADIHIGQIKDYKSVLSKEDLKEFTRAIGLAANGIGIGSFVYMRRIFENLIYSAAKKAIDDGGVVVEDFRKLRMNEKIDALKAYLPATLVELKDMYGIISKGIHELSENECLAYFDVMRNGIELILDDMLDAKRKEEKRKATLASVAKIKGTIVSAE